MMIKNWKTGFICLIAVLLLAACSLPEVTPVIETVITDSPSFVPSETAVPSQTTTAVPVPVAISTKNAEKLLVINRSAVNNAQQLKWANDSLNLLVANQTSDAAGTQLFGVTILGIPDLAPVSIFSTQTDRVADISSDGSKALLVSLDMNSFSVVDLKNANAVLVTVPVDYLINTASFSSDGTMVAISKMDSWEVVLYSAEDGSEIRSLTGFETAAPIYEARFMQSPQWMVWHARGTMQLQEIQSGMMGPTLGHEDFVMAYALTKDGTILASAASTTQNGVSSPSVALWDATTGTQLKTLLLAEPAYCVAFSPNGSLLAIGTGSAIEIWDVPNGTRVASLTGHGGTINSIVFSPDEKYLASTGQDNQLYLWQVSE